MQELKIDEKGLVAAIGERLRVVKETMGMSREEMARMLYVDPSSVSRYVNGTMTPGIAGLVRIYRVLGVSLDWLILGMEPMMMEERLLREREAEPVVEALAGDGDLRSFFERMAEDRAFRYQMLARFFDGSQA